jgi:hypothetical protein
MTLSFSLILHLINFDKKAVFILKLVKVASDNYYYISSSCSFK